MEDRHDEHSGTILIGPGIDEPGLVVDDLPEPGELPPQVEGRRLIVRLLVAFCLCVALAAICFVVLPANGVDIPAWIPLAAMGLIAIAALATAQAEGQLPTTPKRGDQPGSGCGCGDGRAVGCCSGPRPLRMFREPPKQQ